MRDLTATIDFESRSACDIREAGSWRYSLDPTTEPLCFAFRLPYWEPGCVALWHPEFPQLDIPAAVPDELDDLFHWIEDGGLVEAHNAWFERGLWHNIMAPRYGWLPVPASSWRCSAAKAASHALPRHLGDAGDALGLTIQKDEDGKKLMRRLTSPRKVRKAEIKAGVSPDAILYHESREEFERLFAYCRQDVLAEEALSDAIPDLSEQETAVYLLDQQTNERGVRLDVNGVAVASVLLTAESSRLNAELHELTDGEVPRATCRQKLVAWCAARGVHLYDTTKETIDLFLGPNCQTELQPEVRRALEILRALGQSSTAKYETMAAQVCPDERVRGCLLYHGASTGRWSGAGIQPQNFPRGTIDPWDMDLAWEIIKTGDVEFILTVFADTDLFAVLAQALRGALIPSEGEAFYVADYAGIEARVLLWLAEDEDGLNIFREGRDIYCEMASSIYKRPVTKKDKEDRQLGKVAILGLGYQMGYSKFVDTAATYGITLDEEFSKDVVNAYREKFWRVKQLWYDTEDAAIRATRRPYTEQHCGRVHFVREDRFLYLVLPSGRRLAYCDPEVRMVRTPWGAMKPQLSFMGVNPKNKQWQRQATYGGSLVENAVQAVARDLMAEAFVRCADSGVFEPVLTVHDELVAEGEPGLPVSMFEDLVAELPAWADGCPVAAEGWSGERYRK